MSALSIPTAFALHQIPFPTVVGSYRIMRECNPAYCDLYGYDSEELVGRSFRMLYADQQDFVHKGNIFRRRMAESRVYIDERVMRRRDGSMFWCRVYGKSLDPQRPLACAIFCVEPMDRPVALAGKPLSSRQREVCALMAQGLTSAEIAAELGLSRRTVEAHRARLTRQTGARNAAELVSLFCGGPPSHYDH